MKTVCLSFLFTVAFFSGKSQTAEDSVKAVVNQLFDGMRLNDSLLLRSVFAPGARLETVVKNREGVVQVRSEKIDTFIYQITRPRKEVLDERIRFETVKIDADLAIAWTPYHFFIDDKFSHCGVNSFQLVRISGSWKIQYIIDTRRRAGCL